MVQIFYSLRTLRSLRDFLHSPSRPDPPIKNRAINSDSPMTTAYEVRKKLSLFKRDKNDLFD